MKKICKFSTQFTRALCQLQCFLAKIYERKDSRTVTFGPHTFHFWRQKNKLLMFHTFIFYALIIGMQHIWPSLVYSNLTLNFLNRFGSTFFNRFIIAILISFSLNLLPGRRLRVGFTGLPCLSCLFAKYRSCKLFDRLRSYLR